MLPSVCAVRTSAEIACARRLLERYAAFVESLGASLCFQDFASELAGLPGPYMPPAGALWLGWIGPEPVGTIAVKPLTSPHTCEMKRLWVEPGARGSGLGKALAETSIDFARAAGYRLMRLDTLAERMPRAVALYRSLGFVDCAPYVHNPEADALFLELRLS